MSKRLFILPVFAALLAAPAMADDQTTDKNELLNEVRLDHSDWTSNFTPTSAMDQDESAENVRRLHIEKSSLNDDTNNDGDYQSPAE